MCCRHDVFLVYSVYISLQTQSTDSADPQSFRGLLVCEQYLGVTRTESIIIMKLSAATSGAVHLLLIILGVELHRYCCSPPLSFILGGVGAHRNRHHGSNGKSGSMNPSDGSGSNSTSQKAPVFDWGSDDPNGKIQAVQEVTTALGQTAFLHCRVRYLGDRRVLWMRQKDLHILTSSLRTYTNDWRISAVHATVRDRRLPRQHPIYEDKEIASLSPPALFSSVSGNSSNTTHSSSSLKWTNNATSSESVWDDEEDIWSEWTLRIRSTEAKDSGNYECQVSSEPKISKIYRLHVVVSRASILGSAELFVKKGSDINLTCIIDEFKTSQTPLHFTWYHNGQVLTYTLRGGGMSVTTDTIGGQSRLLLARAAPRDSGNYTCVPGPGATSASVTVHVLIGEQPAAMQRDNAAEICSATWHPSWFAFITLVVSRFFFMQSIGCQVT